jgi:hypothetical protein
MELILGIALATLAVAWVLHPVIAGVGAPMERDDDEMTDAQHRKRVALLALRDVEYDYHAGKLDERDYRAMKSEISAEALEALDEEERQWAAGEGADAARRDEATASSSGSAEDVEGEIASLRAALRQGAVCRECGRPNPRGSRFCGRCGSALRPPGEGPVPSPSGSPHSSSDPSG